MSMDITIFAISDLHLSLSVNKPMDIFGETWEGYWDKIKDDWRSRVSDDDVVLISGDISWAMRIDEAKNDLCEIGNLPGKKIILRGNHDYWWSSYAKVKTALPKNMYALQNNALKFDDTVFCGTRGWLISDGKDGADSKKIFDREFIRLSLSISEAAKLRAPNDKLVVMLHYPPFEANLSDTPYTNLINDYAPDAVIYGHLHGKSCRHTPVVYKHGVPYLLTSCDKLNNNLLNISQFLGNSNHKF